MKPSEFYELSDQDKEKHLKQKIESIKNSNNPLLLKMLNIFKRNVKRYPADFLVHDLDVLNELNENFLWLVRSTGTNLIQLDDPEFDKGSWKWFGWYNAIKFNMTPKAYYFVDNKKKTIKKIDVYEADNIMKKYNETYEALELKNSKVA